ncbi:MAG: IclR family transcriptional regulator [Burkholderiales bacterium]
MAATPDEAVKTRRAPARGGGRAARPRSAEASAPTGVVGKALGILEHVGLSGELTLAELKERTGLPRSTLHRLVKLLVDERFLKRSSPSHYRCTLKLWRIGALTADYDDVDERVQPVLRALAESTGETAHYAVYEEGFSVYVAKADARHPLRAGAQVGGRSPAHASATGKAILSWRAESEIRRVGTGAKRHSPVTIVGPDELSREAERVRRSGHAVSRGEWYEELWAVAAPIVDVRGNVVSAIGVAGPTERFKANLDAYTRAVMRAAATLSAGTRPERRQEPHKPAGAERAPAPRR